MKGPAPKLKIRLGNAGVRGGTPDPEETDGAGSDAPPPQDDWDADCAVCGLPGDLLCCEVGGDSVGPAVLWGRDNSAACCAV